MMKNLIKNGLNTGIPFGITIIFLFLIGFTTAITELLDKFLKLKPNTTPLGLTPQAFELLIFIGLIGVWAGATSAGKSKEKLGHAIFLGTLAGLLSGLMVAVVAYSIGSLNAAGVKINTYLAQMLPATIKLFLYEKTPLQGSLIHITVLTTMGAFGGLLYYLFVHNMVKQRLGNGWASLRNKIDQNSGIQKIRANQLARYIGYGLIVLLIILIPLKAGQYWNYNIGTIGIYIVLTLGLNIIVGMAGLLVLGYVAFFAIGAYTVALLTAPQPHHLMWNFWLTIPIGMALAAAAGLLLGIPVLRMRGDYLAIVTLGFGEIIRNLIKSDLLTPFTGGPKGVSNVGGPMIFGKSFSSDVDYVYIIMLAVLLAVFLTIRLQNSRTGRAWEAMREDETVSRAMGINTYSQKLLAFAIGAALAGLAGVLFASRNQFTGPEDHNLMVSINVLAAVIVGGMGSIQGAIAGAFVLKGLPEILRELENYRVITFGALLVIMMIIRPEGLFPPKRRKLDISEDETPETSEKGSAQ
jgi:ABC-type branched-subunit amino acid transport system permease subunit